LAGAANSPCIFCRIINGEAPGHIVFEDVVSLAFLDQRPVFPGHCLLAPKLHCETLMDVPADLLGPLFANAQMLARAMELGLQADGSFVGMNNRVSQSVSHVHIHVVPRRRGDGLKGFFWPRQRYENEEAAVKVRDVLRFTIARLQSERRAQSDG
jgi:histidine triad (HIT) family protein